MMSSEEEADSHAPYSDKLLKKQKRVRQRVDAGEPRNSYSTLATNGPAPARSAHMSGGLYGAIFEGRQHFGLFGPCYAPAEMLNELLGRAPKQEDNGDDTNGGDVLRDRVLRDILQSHKKELMRLSPDNNNVLANNNNDEPKDEKRSPERPISRDSRPDLDDALLRLDNACDSRTSPPPAPQPSEQLLAPKSEPEDRDSDAQRSSPRPQDVKRARVENIVSTMRSSPAPQQPQVNGCKKRKLYHPQQHDGAAERYGASHSSSVQTVSEDSEDDGERPPIQQKLVEKNALKSQLRTMQEQLAEMQEKYLQLCNRMGQESETIDNDGASSDVEQTEDTVPKSEPASPAKEVPPPIPNSAPPNMLSQVMSKMISAKIQATHPHLPPGFNGSLPLLPHLPHGEHMHPPHTHQHLSNAAAMYLNVSQKLFLEQEARMKEASEHQQNNQHRPQSNQHSPQQRQMGQTPKPPLPSELAERLDALRSNAGSVGSITGADLESLAEVLKSEITASLASLIDSIVTRFVHQRRIMGKQSEAAAAAAEQLNKDLIRASRMLDRKSPPPKAPERPPGQMPGNQPVHHPGAPNGVPFMTNNQIFMSHMNGPRAPGGAAFPLHPEAGGPGHGAHMRPPTGLFQTPQKPMPSHFGPMNGHYDREQNMDPSEPLSLVVTPKKPKRHKVTDTRITPRTVSRILGEGMGHSPESKFPESPSPRPYPGGMALPTSVAIPNPSLHESQVFSPYSPFFVAGGGLARSPPAPERDSPPLPNAPTMLHPLLAAAHHSSPDYLRHHPHHPHHAPHHPHHMDAQDHSDCNSTDLPYDGVQPTSSTLTPMHLRKAKLMFFWVRYPSSAVLKMYFPDIKFNKNNTAQLVKWFSNFREFYYIQMEKYARQAISEGLKTADDIHVAGDSELYRVLNLHYNRNNHIEVPPNFRYVVEQTLREFFRAIQGGKDAEQSWKKSIYKVISRLDDPVPEYFKSPNFLEQLE
ncbi:homeobox protein prospero isoform X1 [Pieris rapae]|uniref:homeobox protein prospero isoform X1 n=1 Tax=Pieris rapae TaxID=64459 RepID=UPI001E28089C|nr:homeobox protein prospero isoform X1 [Pieris rapae]XP_045484591.1 homeobox protein prospero isoform X1 [Pieris rapae]